MNRSKRYDYEPREGGYSSKYQVDRDDGIPFPVA
jgi:hypothetical protein